MSNSISSNPPEIKASDVGVDVLSGNEIKPAKLPKFVARFLAIAYLVGLAVALIASIFHNVKANGLSTVVEDAKPAAMILGAIGGLLCLLIVGDYLLRLWIHWQAKAHRLNARRLRPLLAAKDAAFACLLVMGASAILSVALMSLWFSLKWLLKTEFSIGMLYLKVPLVAVVVALASSILFYFRMHLRFSYGVSEALVGLYMAIDKILEAPYAAASKLFWPILTGSVYLIVRGLSNIYDAFVEKEPGKDAAKIDHWVSTRPLFGEVWYLVRPLIKMKK